MLRILLRPLPSPTSIPSGMLGPGTPGRPRGTAPRFSFRLADRGQKPMRCSGLTCCCSAQRAGHRGHKRDAKAAPGLANSCNVQEHFFVHILIAKARWSAGLPRLREGDPRACGSTFVPTRTPGLPPKARCSQGNQPGGAGSSAPASAAPHLEILKVTSPRGEANTAQES